MFLDGSGTCLQFDPAVPIRHSRPGILLQAVAEATSGPRPEITGKKTSAYPDHRIQLLQRRKESPCKGFSLPHTATLLIQHESGVRIGIIASRVFFPLCVAILAMPCRALHWNWQVKKCGHVRDRPVEFLKVHVKRLTFGAARLFV